MTIEVYLAFIGTQMSILFAIFAMYKDLSKQIQELKLDCVKRHNIKMQEVTE